MPPDHLRYRQVLIDAMDTLRDCSVQAERLYLRMAAGAHATRIGVILRPMDLTAECRLRPAEIRAALAELADVGLVKLSVSEAVYLVGHCANCCRRDADVVASWRDEAVRVLCGVRSDLLPQVLEDIDSVGAIAKPRVSKGVAKEREREREKETERDLPADAGAPVAPTPTRTDKRVNELISAYNEARQGRMPQCAGTELQRKDIAAALKRDPVPIWIARIQRACKSSLLKGDKGDWRADLSWILKPRNAEKIDAGNYDDSGPTGFALAGPRGNAPAKPEGRDDTDYLLKRFGVSLDEDNH